MHTSVVVVERLYQRRVVEVGQTIFAAIIVVSVPDAIVPVLRFIWESSNNGYTEQRAHIQIHLAQRLAHDMKANHMFTKHIILCIIL